MYDIDLLKSTKRADQLQFLRFCAFLIVFWGHSSYWAAGNREIKFGLAALSFFFIISGFVVGYTAVGKEVRVTAKAIVKDFAGKLSKLYPLYFFTTIFAIVLEPWFSENLAELNFAFLKSHIIQLIGNLLLIQSWPGMDPLAYNGVGWFLSTLMFLALFNIPIIWLLNKINSGKNRTTILSLLFAGTCAVVVIYCLVMVKAGQSLNYWGYSFPPARLGEYFAGAIAGFGVRIVLIEKPEMKFSKGLFTVFEVGVIILWICTVKLPLTEWNAYIVAWLIPNFAVLIIYGLGKGYISQIFRNKILVLLGDLSFECYLLHQIIIRVFVNLNDIAHISIIGDLWAQAFCFFCTLFLAYLLHGRPLKPKIK